MNNTETNGAPQMTRAQYNEAVEKLATGIYGVLGKAGFNKETLTDLALSSRNGTTWEKLPTKIKLCLIRLAMAMMPEAPPVGTTAPKEQVEEEKMPEKTEDKPSGKDE